MLQESAQPQNLKSLITERYRFKTKQYLRRGWNIFQENWLFLIVYFTIVAAIAAGIVGIAVLLPNKYGMALSLLLALVLFPPLWAGFFAGIFTSFRRNRFKLKDFFQGFSFFPQLAIANLVSGLLIFIGCFVTLILIPGIYLIVGYIFAAPLIIDRRLKFWSAMETSRLIVARQWFPIFAFVLLLGLINLGGALIFGLGLFVTLPVSYCAIAAAYDDIIGIRQ